MKTSILSTTLMLLFAASSLAFAPASTSIHARSNTIPQSSSFVAPTTTTTQLHGKSPPSGYQGTNDGIGRGIYLQLIVFGFCAWMFTIPPEFRRAHFCNADTDRATQECVTEGEWIQGVKDYYAGGGGIKWDFSIDPKTKAANQKKMDEIMSNFN